jgi:hypothetical protein
MDAADIRRRRTAVRIGGAVIALALTLGGTAYAVSGGSARTISACAAKRSGGLRLLASGKHCKRSERLVKWNQNGPIGPQGLQGPQGAPGSQGVQGPTGSVDTSNFYNKVESDGRYLPLHGVADNASELNGEPSSSYVQSGFSAPETLRFISRDVAAGGSDELYPALPSGTLTATCSDPATSSTLQYSFDGTTGHVERTHGSTTTFGTTDTSLLTAANDHVEYLIDYADGTTAKLDVWVADNPDSTDICRFRVFATVVGS